MKRAANPAFLESIANDPRVRPFIGGSGEFRAGDSWKRTIALEWPSGGVVFVREAAGIYSAHLLFLPNAWPLPKFRAALRYMFTRTGCHTVIGATPLANTRAGRIATAAGMNHLGNANGHSHYRLTAREWACSKD
jgi:hypothetical protein